MKIYVLTTKTNPKTDTVSRMVDFLSQRGHEILGIDMKPSSSTYTFEHSIELLKSCDWVVFESSEATYTEGFLTALATNKFQKKTLFVYDTALRAQIPEMVLGCTYPNCHIKSYKSWNELQNILTLLKF